MDLLQSSVHLKDVFIFKSILSRIKLKQNMDTFQEQKYINLQEEVTFFNSILSSVALVIFTVMTKSAACFDCDHLE